MSYRISINKCYEVLVTISQKFCCRKEACGYAKSYSLKKESIKKIDKCLRYLKQWVLWCPPEGKKEMNKIAHVFLQSCFQVSKERYVFKEQSRIRLATIYIHYIHPQTCTSSFDCMTWLSLDLRFDFIIYVSQVCSFMLSPNLWTLP
jgi:hypothetical protein